jgi:cytochrome c553
MNSRFAPAALALYFLTSAAAHGQTQRLAACLACHGAGGRSANALVPSLGGQPAPYLLIQLFLFREKLRSAAVMNEVARALSDEELQSTADELAMLPAPAALAEEPDPQRMQRARALAQKNRCAICHGADFSGHENIPRIGAQREDYLAQTLRAYKSNSRAGYDASMAEVLEPVGDADIADLAYFLARTH